MRQALIRFFNFSKNSSILIKRIFLNKTHNVFFQFARYFVVGAIAFLFDFSALYLLTRIRFFLYYYIFAAAIAFIIGVTVNYFLSIRWVFARKKVKNKIIEFIIFAFIGLVGLFINILLIWLFTENIFVNFMPITMKQVRILISKVIATLAVYLWNFTIKKIVLF